MNARTLLLLGVALLSATCARAYDYIDNVPAWPDGNVTLELQLGSSPTYSDGTTPNSTAIQAISAWNPYMKRVQLTYVNNSSAGKSKTNGKNNIFFSGNVYGSAFGDGVLAVTLGRATASGPIEMDVVVNNAESWDSYRGYLQYPKTDLRRVLAHEFGHVLGLAHPDEAGQYVNALMNAYVSDVDTTVQDDQDGVAARYGRGTANPAVAPTIGGDPYPQTVIEGQSAYFTAWANGTMPLTYQWLKDGNPIAGANDYTFQILAVRSADAGNYALKVTNEAGSATSKEAALTVTPAEVPRFVSQPRSMTVEAGSSVSLDAYVTSNTAITFQWKLNGTDIPNATWSSYYIYGVTEAHAGDYQLVATTVAGSATSETATLTVTPAKPPTFYYHPTGGTAAVGSSFSFGVSVNSSTSVTYQWTRDGSPVPGGTSSYLSISSVQATDAGDYRVTVTNAGGSVTSNAAHLEVVPRPPPPVIRLSNTTVSAGSSLSISPWYYPTDYSLTYQWYRNGTAITGATGSSYYVSSVSAADAGEYLVVATNAAGSSTSTTMTVTVTSSNTLPLGGWKQSVTAGGIVYFLFENPARIERFNTATETWLSAVTLPRAPAVMAVGDGVAYVMFTRVLSRIDLATGRETQLATADSDVVDLALSGDWLYALASDPAYYGYHRIGSFNVSSSTSFAFAPGSYDIGIGLSIDTTHAKAFCIRNMVSPGDITSIALNADGTFGDVSESPYHGDFPNGLRTILAPDNSVVYDTSGIVYSTDDLTFAGSLGHPVDGLAFRADGTPVALRGDKVVGFDGGFKETGALTLGKLAQAIAVANETVYAFTQPSGSGSTITWEKHALSSLAAPTRLPVMRPQDLSFTPDEILQDCNGDLLLFSRLHGNIFRWSVSEQRFLDTIPLLGRPNFITYSAELDRIYLGYADNRITKIDLGPDPVEAAFAIAPQQILGLCSAGRYLLLCDPSGAWVAYFTFDQDGALASRSDWRYFSGSYVWNATKQRVYHFRDDTSPNDLLYTEIGENGVIGVSKDSPYHGEMAPTPPIRISPSGDTILLGSGSFFNADTLAQNNALPIAPMDAAWMGTTVFTARNTLAGATIERWGGSNYGLDASVTLKGRLLRMFAASEEAIVAVTYNSGRVAFTLLRSDLTIKTHFETDPDLMGVRLANLSTRARVGVGDSVMIAGFVVSGTQPKRVLVRAVGPTLRTAGVTGELLDPELRIVTPGGATIGENDDWWTANASELREAFGTAGAFNLPDNSKDAALVVELPPGPYTALVSGKSATQGIALVETYDLDETPGERHLINISTRGVVGLGDNVMIPGLVVEGTSPKRLLIRAIGPGLEQFGLYGVLSDPQFRLVDTHGQTLLSNDNWESDNPDLTLAAGAAAGAYPLTAGSKDAALVATVDPGVYTVIVSGVGNTTGIALVEIYEVP